ncbi:hypothetical protein F3J45_15735 [Pantoea sp. Ap-967]|nr:hypothetical protein [Pantoea sp. Ap-967]
MRHGNHFLHYLDTRAFSNAGGYLRRFAENALTYSTYRGHVERLLLWSLIIREKPVNAHGASVQICTCSYTPAL